MRRRGGTITSVSLEDSPDDSPSLFAGRLGQRDILPDMTAAREQL